MKRKISGSFHLTAAFSLCALMLYIPANLLPFLKMNIYGRMTESTVFSGVEQLYHNGDYFVAIAIFLASIVIPFLKLFGLLFLVLSSRLRWRKYKKFRLQLFHLIASLGRWAMLDVFALAILVTLLKNQNLAKVQPGKGLLAFTLVIFFTLLASTSFDSHSIFSENESEPFPEENET
jgi:paraquat-inducible protein A